MELGNMIFGNSRGEFEVPRQLFAMLFEPLWVRLDGGFSEPFENATFVVRPYYWGDCVCDGEGHEPGCLAALPNFLHKPSGYEIRWYKYPFRDSYANRELTRA